MATDRELEARLESLQGPERVEPLLQLAWRLRRSDSTRALELAVEAQALAAEHGLCVDTRVRALALRATAERHTGHADAGLAHAQAACEDADGTTDADAWAHAHLARGMHAMHAAHFEDARTFLQRGLACEERGAPSDELRTLLNRALGMAHFRLGEPEAAEACLRAAGRLAEACADTVLIGRVAQTHAVFLDAHGRSEEAHRCASRALECARACEDGELEGRALRLLGIAAGRRRAHGEALELLERAARVERRVGARRGLANTLNVLAMEHLQLDMHAEARAFLEEALPLRRAEGDPAGTARTLYYLSYAHGESGDVEAAVAMAEEALQLLRSAGERSDLPFILDALAGHREKAGDLEGALAAFEEERVLGEETDRPEATALGLLGKAQVHLARDEIEPALAAVEAAARKGEEVGTAESSARLHRVAAQVYERSGRHGRALTHLKQVLAIESASSRDIVRAREAAERGRAASEQRLAKAFRNSPDSITITRVTDGRIYEVNDGFESVFGWSRREAIGRTTVELGLWSRAEDRAEFARQLEREGRVRSFTVEGTRKTGDTLLGEISAELVELDGETCVLTVVRDITEKVVAARALQESEARYRQIIESQTEFVARYRVSDGTFLFVNESFADFLGRPREELVGARAPFYSEEDERAAAAFIAQLTPEAPTGTIEVRLQGADGSVHWHEWSDRGFFDEQGTLVEIQGVGRDVTARKQAEDAREAALEEVKRLRDRLQEENLYLREEIRDVYDASAIVGSSPAMRELKDTIRSVARTDTTVLITGETGTGKELVVRALHEASPRARRALIKVNCAAVAAGLVESELFGHERGAFTGALQQRRGRFEVADGGSIFLDEVGELSGEVQAKLLRVLEEGEFERVGSSAVIQTDVRIFAATNRDLEREVEAGRFRSDLFYRLHVFPIHVPALRERGGDVVELAQHFLRVMTQRHGLRVDGFDPQALAWLQRHDWPGNVRELRNLVERAAISTEGRVVAVEDFGVLTRAGGAVLGEDATLDAMQRAHIQRVLARTSWVIEGARGAARILGLPPGTLRSRMQRLGIRKPDRR